MTRVKVHPNRTYVQAGEESCVSVTPARARARAFYVGSCTLKDVTFTVQPSGLARAQAEQVRNVHALAVGELLEFHPERYPLTPLMAKHMVQVTYHYNVGRFLTVNGDPNKVVDVTDGQFKAAYFCGPNFYVSEF